ncbi:hypothetical protein CCY99_01055 [Helicobacter sp. 16-1353]|uniref:hypothetical protein n=1 Tax=Helicobacter sp. 16-1353 TaxID=2004996 RepID=UPI000DCD762F|nr:hypothetical protein [Helicobacter sp. 16-1353]RAX55318.1 hypothetical protein CCY99_01055 [Helicobacter sp. 16-1353]
MKVFLKIALMLGIFASFGFGANEFNEAQTIISGADTNARSVLGTGVKWAFAVALPLICIIAGMIMGYSQQKKKAEQDTNKIYFVTAIAGIVGVFVYVIIAMLISRALFGDTSYIFNVITTFWKIKYLAIISYLNELLTFFTEIGFLSGFLGFI